MSWELRKSDSFSPEVHVVWTRGPHAISPPGWLTVSQTVRELPPRGTKIRLRLSSGESIEQEFVSPKTWREWKRIQASGYGGLVNSNAPEFIEAFTKAVWAEVDVVDQLGVSHAHARIDLSRISDALIVMRRLGAQIEEDTVDYEKRCGRIHIEID